MHGACMEAEWEGEQNQRYGGHHFLGDQRCMNWCGVDSSPWLCYANNIGRFFCRRERRAVISHRLPGKVGKGLSAEPAWWEVSTVR